MEKIIFIIKLSFILNIIIIPFKTYNPLISDNYLIHQLIKNSSDKDIVETISRNLIYTILDIGENRQRIPIFIEMKESGIIIKDLFIHSIKPGYNTIRNSNFTYKYNNLLNNLFELNYYNSSLSKTYKFIENNYEIYADIFLKEYPCGNETIYLNQKKNINTKEINKPIIFYVFFAELENFDHRLGIIGLRMGENKFISNLKKKGEIENYNWVIKYLNNTIENGEIIIGGSPNLYEKANYNENNLRNTKVINDVPLQYSSHFNIYLKFQNKTEFFFGLNEVGTFYIEEYFITGTYEYFMFIEENFFQKYIDEKLCQKHIHKKADYDDSFFHYMCYIESRQKREEFFINFPNLILYQKDMNYNFTFDGIDLFTIIPDNRRILFNIDFSYNIKRWILGKPFFKKYQMIFNPDSKLISYYVEPNSEIKEENKDSHNLKIFIIIILIVLAFILGIIFGRALCSKYHRRIRANELEDNYSYISNVKNNKLNETSLTYETKI